MGEGQGWGEIKMNDFRSGFVAIVGAPNVGKSTLLNRLLGQKISITSKKPQTTRNRILGILNTVKSQIIFFDTPGIHKASGPLNTRIVEAALTTFNDADIILFLSDAAKTDDDSEKIIIRKIKAQNKPVIIALNKIDLIKKNLLPDIIAKWSKSFPSKEIIPISAKSSMQVDTLIKEMEKLLPFGLPFFPDEDITDLSERFLVSELIREKVFRLTGQEIPYSIAVTIDSFNEKERSSIIKIHASIHVERESQKGIVIGNQGNMLKKIGEMSRHDIEKLLGEKVYLKLFVRVQKNWTKDAKSLVKFGY